MQPIISDLKYLQDRWSKNNLAVFPSERDIEKKLRCEGRAATLRVMDVALLILLTFTLSSAACLIISGLITPMQSGATLLSFTKIFTGSILGIISYDLIYLRNVVDMCRTVFREATHCLKTTSNKASSAQRTRWDNMVEKIKKDYEALIIVDTALDMIYPAMTTH